MNPLGRIGGLGLVSLVIAAAAIDEPTSAWEGTPRKDRLTGPPIPTPAPIQYGTEKTKKLKGWGVRRA